MKTIGMSIEEEFAAMSRYSDPETRRDW